MMVIPISRDITIAMYAMPANCSSMTSTRAAEPIGRISPSPVAERVVKLRNSSSRKNCPLVYQKCI
jgi:hypothetical protein